MSQQQCRAFVLRRVRYGEQACLIDVYSRESGRLTLGSRLSRKGQLSAFNQVYILADLEYRLSGGRGYLTGGQIVYDFPGISQDLERQVAAAELATMYLDQVREGLQDTALYELLAYAFYALSEQGEPEKQFVTAALRFLAELGFAPWLEDCLLCHAALEGGGNFDFQRQGLICPNHRLETPHLRQTMELSREEMRLIQTICQAALSDIFRLNFRQETIKMLTVFLEKLCQELLDKRYSVREQLESLRRFELMSRAHLQESPEGEE